MHRAYDEFVLRAVFVAKSLKIASVGAGLAAALVCAGLSACAEDPNYPSLAKISDLGTILTPEERQKAVEELQRRDQGRSAESVKTASN